MREFIYFSANAVTNGSMLAKRGLMQAGRMDIAIHTIIAAFFLSHDFRRDSKLHLIFYGQPDPPKHIEMQISPELKINKKNIADIIKKTLYKYREGEKREVFPGIFVEKKSFLKLIESLIKEKKEIFILDKKGEDIQKVQIPENCVFVLGDQEGLPKKELRRLKEIAKKISIGPKTYFASQTVVIVNNELDRRGV